MSGGEKQNRRQRRYSPTVERLEAVRLLSSATQAHPLDEFGGRARRAHRSDRAPSRTWPMALTRSRVRPGTRRSSRQSSPTFWVRRVGSAATATSPVSATSPKVVAAPTATADTQALTSGLTQLNKYLSRAWYRAGISPQLHDDSTQAVYATLLQNLGRGSLDSLITDVGHSGIKDVFTRETSEGLAFFRAVDMVKKRAQRERIHQSLDSIDVAGPADDQGEGTSQRAALQEAIEKKLNPREAALIQDTLMGKTPAEIASQWGVAPKTVSNEKTRVLQKLRLALADHEMN